MCFGVDFVKVLVEEEEEEEMNFIETHDSYKKLRQKNIAYTIMRLYIQYSTIDNFIIIMVIGRYHNSNMTADMLPPININTKIIKRL